MRHCQADRLMNPTYPTSEKNMGRPILGLIQGINYNSVMVLAKITGLCLNWVTVSEVWATWVQKPMNCA